MSSVIHDKERFRFELEENGHMAFASYRLRDGHYALVHVEAAPELRGTGAAGRLMAGIVEVARAGHLVLAPYCPYAVAWFKRHPDAADVLAADGGNHGRSGGI